jgi:hypothetical protein
MLAPCCAGRAEPAAPVDRDDVVEDVDDVDQIAAVEEREERDVPEHRETAAGPRPEERGSLVS